MAGASSPAVLRSGSTTGNSSPAAAAAPAVVTPPVHPFKLFLCGAVSASLSEAVTFPLDVCKVRSQLHNELNELKAATGSGSHPHVMNSVLPSTTAAAPTLESVTNTATRASAITAGGSASSNVSMLETAGTILRLEGVSGFYKGLAPALVRQFVYQGINLSLYKPVRNVIHNLFTAQPSPPQPPLSNSTTTNKQRSLTTTPDSAALATMPLYQRVMAGCISGACGQFIASPTDVCKIRLQADGRRLFMGQSVLYPRGARDVLKTVWENDGWRGLWKGVGPNMTRAAVVNGASIATYDHYKTVLLKSSGGGGGGSGGTNPVRKESVWTHVGASLMSGVMCTAVSAPIDLIKTRYINEAIFRPPLAPIKYHSPWDCIVKTIRSEGVWAMWKGFVPTYMRIGPYQLVFVIVYENIQKAVTGNYF